AEAPGPINFTMFLTLFGEKLNGTDPEDTILNAFKLFDEDNSGKIGEDYLTTMLTTMGDRLNKEEIDLMYQGAPLDDDGWLNYPSFVRIIKHGTKDEELVKA
ncbi:EF-hand domain-containing protein, partial [Salmonella sp. s51228]|uniref:EF-hand domain-containing protein n=1 Tax=Salmonella sp. s51228 TaxID=3159652 RepID=UPI003980CD21